jgi:hypothetical protein
MRIGQSTIPRMCVPALLKGKIIHFNLARQRGRWGIMCHLPPIEFCEAVFLNQYHRTIQQHGARILGLLPFPDPLVESDLPKAKVLNVPLLADPLGRLHRVLGLSRTVSSTRCRSFIFDSGGVIRYHLVHGINWHGMNFLVEILKYCQQQLSQPVRQFIDPPALSKPDLSEYSSPPEGMREMDLSLLLHHAGENRYATE